MRLGAKGWVLVARTVRSWGCRPVRLCHRGNSQEFRGDQRYKSVEAVAAFRRQQEQQWKHRNRTVLTYLAAGVVGMAGLSYAAVPLYRLYCQQQLSAPILVSFTETASPLHESANLLRELCKGVLQFDEGGTTVATGISGSTSAGHSSDQIETMEPIKDRIIKVTFNSDVHSSLQWNFKPQQTEVYVVPGETALAFYKAKNPTDRPIIGISTYNILPPEAGQYFNKIQCFCFEEQRLNPREEVDMPVFFFIDPEFVEDPRMEKVNLITLSYTFFEAKTGYTPPLPGYN